MVTVYVDVLILLNAVVDFLILLVTAALAKEQPRTLRLILASFAGSLFSLYIFLPSTPFAVELAVRVAASAVTVLICFGRGRFLRFLRLTALFYATSFLYVGVMLAGWFLFEPERMAINNGVVYVDLSPGILLVTAALCYLVLTVLRLIARRNGAGGERVMLALEWQGREITVPALIDTGHGLRDDLLGRPVIVAEQSVFRELLSSEDFDRFQNGSFSENDPLCDRYRLIPCTTVGGHALLPSLRCDTVRVSRKDTLATVRSPLLALSAADLGGDYRAVAGTDLVQVMI